MVQLPFAFFHNWYRGIQSRCLWTKDEKPSGNGLQGSLRVEYWFGLHAPSLITQVWATLDPFHMEVGCNLIVMG